MNNYLPQLTNLALLEREKSFRMAINRLIGSGFESPEPILTLHSEHERIKNEISRRNITLTSGLDFYPAWEENGRKISD